MKRDHVKIMNAALVFTLMLCTVAPVAAFATDSVTISNSAQSVSNTGNQTGADGRDGADGAPGEDGKPGEDGSSGSEGDSSASAHIQTTIGDDGTVNVDKTVTSTGGATATAHATTSVAGDAGTSSLPDPVTVSTTGDMSEEMSSENAKTSSFMNVLSSIRSILLTYVEMLF